MKKGLIIGGFIATALLPGLAIAESATQGVPFQALWDAVNAINTHIQEVATDLQNQINNVQLTPGPQGPQGEQGPQGLAGESNWDETRVALLEQQITELRDRLSCLSRVGTDLYFDGCNISIRNGTGNTLSANGLGNLTLGYNEPNPYIPGPQDHSGSHILVIGPGNSYSGFSGMVVGNQNTITGDSAVVVGGSGSVASGYRSAVFGGGNSTASGRYTSVFGGSTNVAIGEASAIMGGYGNTTTGFESSISGGFLGNTNGIYSSVTGGYYNTALGDYSSVNGGSFRTATGTFNWVAGGLSEAN